MRAPVTWSLAAIIIAGTALAACAPTAAPATPPPAESYTAFSPVELKVKSDPDWLATGFGSVWLKRPEGFVDRIDPVSATVIQEIQVHEERPEACDGVGSGAINLWTCDSNDLVGIDPANNEVVTTVPAGKIPAQGRIVTAAGRMWVLAGDGDRLVGIQESDGSMSEPIVLPVACHDLGAHAEAIYVVCERGDRILRVDPATGAVTAEVTITKPSWVSAAASGVWVSAEQDILRLDPVTLATSVTVPGMGTGSLGAIRADDGGVWVRRADPFLARIDATGSIARVISAPFRTGGDVLVDGDHVWATSIDDRLVIRLEVPTGG